MNDGYDRFLSESYEDIDKIANDDMDLANSLGNAYMGNLENNELSTEESEEENDKYVIRRVEHCPDNPCFQEVTEDELDFEADKDFQFMNSLGVKQTNNPIEAIAPDMFLKRPLSQNIQAADTLNAFSMAQSLVNKCHFLLVDKAVYCYIDRVYVLLDDVELDRLILRYHKDAIGMQGRPGIITEIRKFIKLGDVLNDVETDKEHIVFLNGRYDLVNNRFEPNDSDIFATSYLNFNYDSYDDNCDHFKSFLKFVTGENDQLKHLILEVMGYLLSCNNTAKKFFVLFGPGNTGKSLFISLMSSFFPLNFVSTIELQDLGGRFSSGNLVDRRLNIGGDLPNKVLSTDVIKTVKCLTGNDVMTAERKFQQPFSYKPTAKLLFATNHKITMAYKDEQFIERLVVIPFMNPVSPEMQDKELLDKMKAERAAIFNKALKAFKRLERNNFIFTEAEESQKFVNFPTGSNENQSFLSEAINQFCNYSEPPKQKLIMDHRQQRDE